MDVSRGSELETMNVPGVVEEDSHVVLPLANFLSQSRGLRL